MTPRRFTAAAIAFASIALAPALAAACPVCFSARDGTRLAYAGTAVLMSLLPLAMFGTIGWWIRRAVRERDAKLTAPSDERLDTKALETSSGGEAAHATTAARALARG